MSDESSDISDIIGYSVGTNMDSIEGSSVGSIAGSIVCLEASTRYSGKQAYYAQHVYDPRIINPWEMPKEREEKEREQPYVEIPIFPEPMWKKQPLDPQRGVVIIPTEPETADSY